MTRPAHPGRPSPSGPFSTGALAAARTVAAATLTETCRIGTWTDTVDPNPPYATTSTFTPTASGVPCAVEPHVDRQASAGDDPSTFGMYDLRLPHGTALTVDQAVEITAGPNTGLALQVLEIHDSSTEPLARATCERIDQGDP